MSVCVCVCVCFLLSALCSLSSSVPHQFHVVNELKNWTEAQQYCRENFTDLATIDDMTEMEEVRRLMQKAGGNAWIGLRNGSSPRWQWSLANRDFYKENEAEFRNWDSGQPQEHEDDQCVTMKGNGTWQDDRCSNSHPFICYDGRNSTHPYVLVNEGKNWTEAQRYCRENHTDLASVRNQTENDQIKKVSEPTDVWIGLFRDAWEWSDGSNSSFRHWKGGEPNYGSGTFCTETDQSDGMWNDAGCQHAINFICYTDKLVLIRDNKTWNEALQYCQEHFVDLVSVRSERVQRWVTERAKGASTAHVWLGLRYTCGVGWFWVYGETVCYRNWAPDQEQVQNCVERVGAVKSGEDGGKWVSNMIETEKLNFICSTEDE